MGGSTYFNFGSGYPVQSFLLKGSKKGFPLLSAALGRKKHFSAFIVQ
jgi:hypothetical protein